MNKKLLLNGLILVAALVVFLYFQTRKKGSKPANVTNTDQVIKNDPAERNNRSDGLNRRVTRLIYTRHARCRMDCRHIDESEVKEILENGEINQNKSELNDPRGPKYAVEGNTHDGQRVRIIFAQDPEGTAVVTVIDLGTEWHCDCK